MINNNINSLIMSAMKAGKKEKLAVLKLIKAKFIEEKHRPGINPEADLPEAEEIRILRNMIKEREKSIEEYKKAGRDDLVENERSEILIISDYLPTVPGEDETKALVYTVIGELGGNESLSMKDMKTIMTRVREKNSAIDNAVLARIVKQILQSK